jgi:3-oxoacyl-[acyl-carrier protein] reductase
MEQRVAIVTGGASGIGRATAVQLAAQGVKVVVFDREVDPGGQPSVVVDVTDGAAVSAAVEDVRAGVGPIDIVVNAAGTPAGGPFEADGYLAEWERALAVNLTGTMLVTRACIGDLVASGHGRIVNVASTEALGASRSTSPYSASKHGVVGFTRGLAVDYGRVGVTANCVCPGATLTGMTAAIPAERRDAFARRSVPVGRYAAPEEVAFMIVALTSLAASYVNGAVIPVDGGLTARSY